MGIRHLFGLLRPSRERLAQPRPRINSSRLRVEALEDRSVPATLSIGDVTVAEGISGNQTAALTVTLSEPLNKAVTVNYGTFDGSATAGSDYAAKSGKLTFAKGETTKTILVRVYGDQRSEPNETFTVRLSNPKGATIADNSGVVTIMDSTLKLSVTNQSSTIEGDLITFTISLSAPLDTAFTVNFATADYTTDRTLLDAAFAGEDYVATSGTLIFAPGETSKTFTVQTIADGVEEYDELFAIWFSNPSLPVLMTNGWLARITGERGEW